MISCLFFFNFRKLFVIFVKLVIVMMCSGFWLKCCVKKRWFILVVFFGFFILVFYFYFCWNKDNVFYIIRIKLFVGIFSNIFRLCYCNILVFGVYILICVFYFIFYLCVMYVFFVWCYICKLNVLLGFNWFFEFVCFFMYFFIILRILMNWRFFF